MTFISELSSTMAEIRDKSKKFDAFDVTTSARVYNALKEEYPDKVFSGPLQDLLPESPGGNGLEEITFVVANSKEAYDKLEEER